MEETRRSSLVDRVRSSFDRQPFMSMIGARLTSVARGSCRIELPYSERLAQQHGYLHAGVVAAVLDTACGYAALSLMDEMSDVLTVEYKINLLSPATGEQFVARGRARRAGKTLTVCQGAMTTLDGDATKTVALMTATIIRVQNANRFDRGSNWRTS
jgi:uncharacterized protein (TIGR00369 family)